MVIQEISTQQSERPQSREPAFLQTVVGPEAVVVTLIRSAIGSKPKTRGTLRALGLRKIGDWRAHRSSDVLAGMLRRVDHLVKVEVVRVHRSPALEPTNAGLGYGLGWDGKLGVGLIEQLDSGQLIRVERISEDDPYVLIGWRPATGARSSLLSLYEAGDEAGQFTMLKLGRLIKQDPWTGVTPGPLLESPRNVALAKYDTEAVSVSWERGGSNSDRAEFFAHVSVQSLSQIRSVIDQTSIVGTYEALESRLGDVK